MPVDKELTWQATAAANILQARRKRGRIGIKKSTTGCGTCKLRHVKCDEGRPECHRCVSTGRRCDGYLETRAPRQTPTSLIGMQLSQELGLRASDKRSFDYFLSYAAPRISSSFDKEFWCRDVLQYARSESLILDTLLAISVLYEHPQFKRSFLSHEENSPITRMVDAKSSEVARVPDLYFTTSPTDVLPMNDHHIRALVSYNRALNALGSKVEKGEARPDLLLLSCVLFICVELERDNVFAALKLLRHGTQLLRQYSSTPDGIRGSNELVKTIEQMFTRLGILAALWGTTTPYEMSAALTESLEPSHFKNAADARIVLYALLVRVHAFQIEATKYLSHREHEADPTALDDSCKISLEADLRQIQMADSTPRRDSSSATRPVTRLCFDCEGEVIVNDASVKILLASVPSQIENTSTRSGSASLKHYESMSSKMDELKHRLKEWRTSFSWTEGHDDESATEILMAYHAAYIWLCTRLSITEMDYDLYTEHFAKILRYAELHTKVRSTEDLTFTFEVGAVLPLFCVALKCRVPSYRRKALALLLRAPKKACHFGSKSTAELAARCIAIEEEGLWQEALNNESSTQTPDILPCEDKRIRSFELIKNNPERRWEVRVLRLVTDRNGHRSKHISDHPI